MKKNDYKNKKKELSELQSKNVFSEITQYENNITFLSKDKNTAPLVKNILDKINRSIKKIEKIKQKLEILKKG